MPADQQIKGAAGSAPQEYEVPNSVEIIPKVVAATFDGTGAGSTWVPAVEIISDGGVRVALIRADETVAAGGSADVTFAPFLRTASSGGTDPNAVHYNAATESGTFLQTLTTGAFGTHIDDTGGGVYITSTDGTFGFIELLSANQMQLNASRVTPFVSGQMDVHLGALSASFSVVDRNGHTIVESIDGTGNNKLNINDQTGAPIFQIWDDGSIHGRAAVGAITWDL